VTETVRRTAYFFDEWHESLFTDATDDVYLPGEEPQKNPKDDENPDEE
jgi:hypothetical protein